LQDALSLIVFVLVNELHRGLYCIRIGREREIGHADDCLACQIFQETPSLLQLPGIHEILYLFTHLIHRIGASLHIIGDDSDSRGCQRQCRISGKDDIEFASGSFQCGKCFLGVTVIQVFQGGLCFLNCAGGIDHQRLALILSLALRLLIRFGGCRVCCQHSCRQYHQRTEKAGQHGFV
jgi:hypothetical protein